MNQHDQMLREALRLLQEIHPGNMTPMAEESWKAATVLIEQALAAEPAPLLRLTDEEIEALRHKTFSTNNPFCPCDVKTMRKAANAVIDAMIAANK